MASTPCSPASGAGVPWRLAAALAALCACGSTPSHLDPSSGTSSGTGGATGTAGPTGTGAATVGAPDACASSEDCAATTGPPYCVAPYDPGTSMRGPAVCSATCIGENDLTRWCLDHDGCCEGLLCRAVDGFCEPPDLPGTGTSTGTSTGTGG